MFRYKAPLFAALILLFVASCDGLKFPKNIFDTSDRDRYERRFSGPDSLMNRWKNEYSAAAQNQLKILDGFSATAFSGIDNLNAYGYSLDLKRGDQLVLEVKTENPETKFFVDVFETSSAAGSSESILLENGTITRVIENTSSHKIIIQPEIEFRETFTVKVYTQPSLGFPVARKGNRDVQSFWGASRDGGGRSHEGVDIFATRGTPVVAATNGYITRTGNSGLGGKQVWLRDGLLGNSLYYAHLDSIMVQEGVKVKPGDTLGLVGSTGNAEGGSPHLHFGIYSTGGAVDPYPYIHKRPVPASRSISIPSAKSIKAGTNLRSGPGMKYEVMITLAEKKTASILAGDGEWFHVKLKEGTEGFVTAGRVE